jgi:hypothetical protein
MFDMRRREFIRLLGVAAAAWPLAARAQHAKVWRVGWIWIGRSAGISPEVEGFRQGLKDFGYVEGDSISVEYRFAEGRRDRITDLIAELLGNDPQWHSVSGVAGIGARGVGHFAPNGADGHFTSARSASAPGYAELELA